MQDDARQRLADEAFAAGRAAAREDQFHTAIEYFLQGLAVAPARIDAHRELRTISLQYRASGGQALGMFESMKLQRSAGDPIRAMVNAERLLCFDCGNSDHMLAMLQSAAKAGLQEVVDWIEPMFKKMLKEQ